MRPALVFEGWLPAEQGALLLMALERAMEWLFQGELGRCAGGRG